MKKKPYPELQDKLIAVALGLALTAGAAWALVTFEDGGQVCGRGGCASVGGTLLAALLFFAAMTGLALRDLWRMRVPPAQGSSAPLRKRPAKPRKPTKLERELVGGPSTPRPPEYPYGTPEQYEAILRKTGVPEDQIRLILEQYGKA